MGDRWALVEAGLAELLRLPLTTPEPAVFARAVDLAEQATDSGIGYLHYVNDDQSTLELGTWSSRTVRQCAVSSDRHYPIAQAGVWADTFRTRKPCIHNDYPSLPVRRGLPDGHVAITRHLGVAVVESDMVRLLLGVGNKSEPYDTKDVRIAQAVADDVWLVTTRLRAHARDRETLSLLTDDRTPMRVSTWEWDKDIDAVAWGPDARAILEGSVEELPRSWRALAELLTTDSARRLEEALFSVDVGASIDLSLAAAGPSERTYRVSGSWVPRSTGFGSVMRGIVTDTSLHTRFEEARYASVHDPLTGLLNRAGLAAELSGRMEDRRQRSNDEFAVLFIDLDEFKAVNDHFGHPFGDEVLAECATRLLSTIRGFDAAARYGGDEFVVVQGRGPSPEEVERLGHRVIDAISKPMVIDGRSLRIGASVGAARSTDTLPGPEAIVARADAALYQAKARGGGAVVLGAGIA